MMFSVETETHKTEFRSEAKKTPTYKKLQQMQLQMQS